MARPKPRPRSATAAPLSIGGGPAGRRTTRPPLERMLRIHQAIQAGGYPNAETLARELEVCTKSIRRDLEFMRDRLGLPLCYDERRWGYHYTEDVGAFPSLQISEGELFALLVAEKAIQQYRGTSFEQPLTSALRKMSAGLPDTVSVHWADWDRTISFRTSAEPILNLEVFDKLARAVADRERLRIEYRKPGASASETREIDPWHLANINGEWYLFAHDHLRKAVRTFVPARIQSVAGTGKTFTPPTRFSVDRELRDSFGVHSAQGEFEVMIRFSPRVADYIREKRWHASQKLSNRDDGGVELRMRLSSLVEVQRWILGWGGDAVPVQPPELVTGVREAARRLLKAQSAPANAGQNRRSR